MPRYTSGNTLIDPSIIIRKANIGRGMRVADLGCGSTGHFIFPVADAVKKEGAVYAVDILKTSLSNVEHRAIQENFSQVITVWSNLEIFKATDIETASLDVVLIINVLYQSNKRIEIIREAIRLVKKSGKIIIVDWNSKKSPFGPSISNRVNVQNLLKVAERLDLKLLEEFNAGEYHFGLVFKKQ